MARSAFDDDIAELRAAREWLLHDGDLDRLGELSACTHWFAMLRTRMEFNRWAEDAVGLLAQRVPDHPRLGQLRACAAMGAVKRGDLARARATAQAAGPGDRFCVEILAQVDLFEGRLADAAERARRAAALHREAGDERLGDQRGLGRACRVGLRGRARRSPPSSRAGSSRAPTSSGCPHSGR